MRARAVDRATVALLFVVLGLMATLVSVKEFREQQELRSKAYCTAGPGATAINDACLQRIVGEFEGPYDNGRRDPGSHVDFTPAGTIDVTSVDVMSRVAETLKGRAGVPTTAIYDGDDIVGFLEPGTQRFLPSRNWGWAFSLGMALAALTSLLIAALIGVVSVRQAKRYGWLHRLSEREVALDAAEGWPRWLAPPVAGCGMATITAFSSGSLAASALCGLLAAAVTLILDLWIRGHSAPQPESRWRRHARRS